MDDQTKEKIRKNIILQIESLEENIVKLKELTKPIAPSNAIGRLSRMEALNEKSINESALAKSQARIIRLKNTLPKLTERNYGICVECEEEIPLRRLLSIPESTICVSCIEKNLDL